MGSFATRLKEIREQAGLSQAELAKRAGMHRFGIAKLEQGMREPTWATLQALADALGVECTAFRAPQGVGKRARARLKIRKLPRAGGGRVESGPIEFGDDCPGLFLCGDDCATLVSHIRDVLSVLTAEQERRVVPCALCLNDFAEMIEKRVLLNPRARSTVKDG